MNGQHDHEDHYYTKSQVDDLIAGITPPPIDPTPPLPDPTTPPTTDITLNPGESIQAAVNNNQPGTAFLLKSGSYPNQLVKPKEGMAFIGEPGAVLDGGNYAFVGWEDTAAHNVTLRGLEIRNFKPSFASHAAIHAPRLSNWLVEDCNIHDTLYAGIYLGPGCTIRNVNSHHNGRIGAKQTSGGGLIENCEFNHNNLALDNDPLWEAGGIKFGAGDGTIVRNNYVHNNNGPGIWADVGVVGAVIEDNLIEDSGWSGVDYEISSFGTIRRNTIRRCGLTQGAGWMWGAGIQIRSPDVDVYENTVEDCYNGIGVIETNRNNVVIDRVNVYDNDVSGSVHWQAGAVDDVSDALLSRDIKFSGNTYDGGLFSWNATLTFDEWQALGFDRWPEKTDA